MSLVRRKDLGFIQTIILLAYSLQPRWGQPDAGRISDLYKLLCIGVQVIHLRWIMTSRLWDIYVQILHSSFRIGGLLRGIQSTAKNLLFLFFRKILSFRNRKMRKPFQLKVRAFRDPSADPSAEPLGDTKRV